MTVIDHQASLRYTLPDMPNKIDSADAALRQTFAHEFGHLMYP